MMHAHGSGANNAYASAKDIHAIFQSLKTIQSLKKKFIKTDVYIVSAWMLVLIMNIKIDVFVFYMLFIPYISDPI